MEGRASPEGTPSDECSVCVAVHIRPLIDSEITEGCQHCLGVVPNEPQVMCGSNSFTYDSVFGGTGLPPARLYETCVLPLVQGLFKGYNATVFAYGQTGSGKTYTMGSAFQPGVASSGVIPRVMETIFNRIASTKDAEFTVRVAFVEIHKEEIRDLMVTEGSVSASAIHIREVVGGGVCLAGATEKEVRTREEMAQVLEQGSLLRATGSTGMNRRSSRSHAIFTITLEQRRIIQAARSSADGADQTDGDDEEVDDYLCAKMHLVDLAGSERAKRTKAEGARLKEGIHINQGLFALGNVISALSEGKAHVPYRDSKLTRMLQDSLGGNSRTLMLACVSPADVNMEESVNTLRYAARARNIRNKPVINRDPHAAQIALLRQQLAAAHAENAALRRAAAAGGVGISIPDSLRGSAETSESILAEALDELQAANSKLEVEKTRLQLEVVTLKAELGEKTDALLSVEAQRDTLLLKLQRARAGDCSVRSSITDGAPQEMRADDGLAANGVTGMHGDVRDPAPADELVDEDLQVDDVVKKYLRKIARLEKEVKRLKQVQRVSGAFIVQQRRQSLTPLRANLPMEGGATPLSGAPLPPPDTPGGFDFSLDQPCDEEALAEDEHFVVEEHAHRVEQKRVQAELEGLQRTLEAKEAQMARMVGGRGQISAMKQHYDRILADLQNERDDLARERAELVQRLHALRESTEEGKAAAEKRLKKALQEMDARMKEVAAREKKAAQVDRLAARSQEAVARLQQDIAAIKQQKVALARQMEKSAREFQEWKRGREREVLQLKRQGLKTAAQVQRLEALQAKQQAVLRRKTEEAESARRRLKDIMEVHRQAGEQRKERAALGRSSSQPGTSVECQPNNTAPLLRDEKARREWLEHELDLCCQSFELQKVLEGEKAMRADAAHQLQELERRAARPAPPDPDTAAQLEALRAKVRHHSGQILETQQALVAAKAEDTARGGGSAGADVRRWTGLRNLVEARALLKTLFRSAAQLRAQVYETASELTEAREESEVLRIRFEAAEQEVEAARQAAAAAQAAAMLAHSKSPCPSPQRPSQLSHPIPEEDEALESLIGEIEDFPERNPLDDVDNADGLPPLSRPTSLLRSRDSNPHQHPHQEPSPRRQLFVQQRPAWRNEIPEEPDDEDEEEEEEDEDDEKWGEDPAWDPSSATPAIGNRRRPRGSTAMRSGSLPLHVLGTQEGPSPATAHRIVRGEQEAPVLMAINAERARQGEPRVDRLTVRILKAHLQGKSVAGRRWSASGKKREDLIADFRAYLGMGELKGEGMAAMTPRVPQLEGTPGTGSSRGSPGALSERSRMSHSAEQLPRGRPISPALDPLDSANSDTASGSPQRAGHAGGDPVAKLVPPLALKDNDSAAELGSDFILEGRTAAGGSRPSSGRPAGLELWHNTLGTGPRPQETGPGARLARGMDSLQSATLGMVPREPVPGVQDPELLSVEGHGLRILQDWPSGPPPTGVARTPAARFYLDECSAALRRAQALRARLGSRASRGLPSLSPSSSPSGSIGQRGPSPSSLDRPPRPTSAAPEHADPAEAFSPPVSCPPLHSGPIAPCENFSLDGAAPPGPDTEPPPPFSDFSPAGRTVLGDIANAGEPKLVRTGSLGSGGAALEVAASLKPAKESASAAKPPKPLPVLPNIVVPKVAGPPGEAKTGATPRARAWL